MKKRLVAPFYPLFISCSLFSQVNATLTDVDGNVYKTVIIGTQIWMAENLKTMNYSNGDPILNIPDSLNWIKLTLTKDCYCSYKNVPNNGSKFGLLYNFKAMSDKRNVCPDGWHIPNLDEIKILSDFLGGQKISGEKLKSTYGWSLNNNGTNSSGFKGEPYGFRSSNGGFFGLSYTSSWWSSSGEPFMVSFLHNELINSGFDTQSGYYIRCIKDKL